MREKNSTQIIRIDGKNSFVEILSSAFSIGKVQFCFCEYDEATNKQTKRLDIYLDISKALVLANDILSGQFGEMIKEAKKTNTFNGSQINNYTSYYANMGGISEERVASRFDELQKKYDWLTSGSAISRVLKIQTGMKQAYILRAEYGLGKSNVTGLIVPNGTAKDYINIPLSEEVLKEIAIVIKTHYEAYLNQYYSKFAKDLFPNDRVKVFQPK